MTTKTLWRCPKCGRLFAKTRQSHSCAPQPVDQNFEGKPACLKEVFDELLRQVRQYGPVRTDAVKSSIHFASKHRFAAVHVLRNSLSLEFILDRKLEHQRILRSQKFGKKSYSHFVKLAHKEDIDGELMRWLRRAYALKS